MDYTTAYSQLDSDDPPMVMGSMVEILETMNNIPVKQAPARKSVGITKIHDQELDNGKWRRVQGTNLFRSGADAIR